MRRGRRRHVWTLGDASVSWKAFPIVLLLSVVSPVFSATAPRILINGTGSSAPGSVYSQYNFVYSATQAVLRNIPLNAPYLSQDSQYGIIGVGNGWNAWGGSDLPLTTDESATLRILPTMIGATAIVYNLPPLYNSPYPLNLSQEALVGIFNGTIRSWSAPVILRDNPVLVAAAVESDILDKPPVVVVRNDTGSGQTRMVSACLSSMDPAWNATYGTFSDSVGWPVETLAVSFDKLPVTILLTDFSIGYTDMNAAWTYQLSMTALQNRAGFFVTPTNLSILSAAANFASAAAAVDLTNAYVPLVDGSTIAAYPIAGATYAVVSATSLVSCDVAYELVRYLYWIVGVPPVDQQAESARIARLFGYIGVSEMQYPPFDVYPKLAMDVLGLMRCSNGLNLLSVVLSDLDSEKSSTQGKILVIAVSVMAGIVVVTGLGLWLWWRRTEKQRAAKVKAGASALVDVPKEVREKSQKEINETVNKAALQKTLTSPVVGLDVVASQVPLKIDLGAESSAQAASMAVPEAETSAISSLDNELETPLDFPGEARDLVADTTSAQPTNNRTQSDSDLPAPLPTPRAPRHVRQDTAPPRTFTSSDDPLVDAAHASAIAAGPHAGYQTTLIRSSTGALRAVVGPVRYTEELYRSIPARTASGGTKSDTLPGTAPRPKRSSTMLTAASVTSTGGRVAAPITVKPRWQRSYVLHVTWVVIRTGMDLVAVLLNWIGFLTLPDGLLLAGVYAALCVVGSIFFVFNMLAATAGLLYHKKNKVELEASMIRNRRRVSVDQLAYIKNELRRLQIICVREIVYRVSLLLREIPLILVAIVIVNQTTFVEIWLELGLVANAISLGFKLRSVPQTVDDFISYVDMRDLYAVLKSPSLSVASTGVADESVNGDPDNDEGEDAGYSYHEGQVPASKVTKSAMTDVLMSFGGLERAPRTMERIANGEVEALEEDDGLDVDTDSDAMDATDGVDGKGSQSVKLG